MEDFFDRLDKYMTFSGLNDNKLTVKAGLSIGSLGKQRKGSRGLSSDSIAKILYCCDDLNADWLLTGRGEMIGSKNVAKSEPTIIYRDNPKDAEIISLQREQIKFLKAQISDLKKVSAGGSATSEDYTPAVAEILSTGSHNNS